jgi:hypothetical protein
MLSTKTSELLPLLTVSVFSCTIIGSTPVFTCTRSYKDLSFLQAKDRKDEELNLIVQGSHQDDGACMVEVSHGDSPLITYLFVNEKVEVHKPFNLF